MRSGVMFGLALTALAVLSLARVSAGDKGPMVGDKAPTFESVDEQGKPWKSAARSGRSSTTTTSS